MLPEQVFLWRVGWGGVAGREGEQGPEIPLALILSSIQNSGTEGTGERVCNGDHSPVQLNNSSGESAKHNAWFFRPPPHFR